MKRYRLTCKVKRDAVSSIQLKCPTELQPKVQRRFMRRSILSWEASTGQLDMLLVFLAQYPFIAYVSNVVVEPID